MKISDIVTKDRYKCARVLPLVSQTMPPATSDRYKCATVLPLVSQTMPPATTDCYKCARVPEYYHWYHRRCRRLRQTVYKCARVLPLVSQKMPLATSERYKCATVLPLVSQTMPPATTDRLQVCQSITAGITDDAAGYLRPFTSVPEYYRWYHRRCRQLPQTVYKCARVLPLVSQTMPPATTDRYKCARVLLPLVSQTMPPASRTMRSPAAMSQI